MTFIVNDYSFPAGVQVSLEEDCSVSISIRSISFCYNISSYTPLLDNKGDSLCFHLLD